MPRKVFLSYVSEDQEKARVLAKALEDRGLQVWLDENALRPGDDWPREVRRAVQSAAAFVPLLSTHWVGRDGWYMEELRLGLDRGRRFPDSQKFVFPVRLEHVEPSRIHDRLARIQLTDLFGSAEAWRRGVERLARELSVSIAGREGEVSTPKRKAKSAGPRLVDAPSRSNPPTTKVQGSPDFFRKRLEAKGAPWDLYEGVSAEALRSEVGYDLNIPKFLLWRRSTELVLTIAARGVDDLALQKTTENKECAHKASAVEMESAGFSESRIHPFFKDPDWRIHRIFLDTLLAAQAVRAPGSRTALPLYRRDGSEDTVVTSIRPFVEVLQEAHPGVDRVIVGNIARNPWPDGVLDSWTEDRPVRTRYAATPSGFQHAEDARTALLSYLFHLRYLPRSEFHLRIDDTNLTHRSPELTAKLEEELRWLGIRWSEASSFRQSDARSLERYRRFAAILELTGLAQRTKGGVKLGPLPQDAHLSLWVDLRRGPRVRHDLLKDKKGRTKEIKLVRNKMEDPDEVPYYRFAGLIDDLGCSHVFRDAGQAGLTVEQGYIRSALEYARLHHRSVIAGHLIAQGLDPDAPLPLPVYGHVPQVVPPNGEKKNEKKKLSKRSGEHPYSLDRLRQEGILPEAMVAWLLATMLPPSTSGKPAPSWHRHLFEIARTVAQHNDLDISLRFFARRLEAVHVVPSQEEITLDLQDLYRVNRMVMRHMLTSTLMRRLRELPVESGSLDHRILHRVQGRLHDFASSLQVLRVLSPQRSEEQEIRSESAERLSRCLTVGRSQHVGDALGREIAALVESGDRDARVRFYQDLRLVLTGHESSPRIDVLLSVLPPTVVEERVRSFLEKRECLL